jgi:hypothetical protein
MYFDGTYLMCVALPTLLLSAFVQIYLRSTYSKWNKVPNGARQTGAQVAQGIFSRTSLTAVPLERVPGQLTDHFDPAARVVRLSDAVGGKATVGAMAVAAHELGHVQQYETGSGLIKMRSFLLPALQFSPMLSYGAFFLGIMFNMTGLLWAGVLLFSLMVVFSLLTLPVELDASRRALRLLDEAGLMVTDDDRKGSRQVLRAAALTYLAAAITSVLQLLYYISIARRNS